MNIYLKYILLVALQIIVLIQTTLKTVKERVHQLFIILL